MLCQPSVLALYHNQPKVVIKEHTATILDNTTLGLALRLLNVSHRDLKLYAIIVSVYKELEEEKKGYGCMEAIRVSLLVLD